MIIGKIIQQDNMLLAEDTNIAYQYAENLQLSIEFDDKFAGYSWQFFCGYKLTQIKAITVLFDSDTQTITLPAEALKQDGSLYIQAVAIKDNLKFPLEPVKFIIGQSLPQNFIGKDPTDIEILQALIKQIVKNEYDQPLQNLITEATNQQEESKRQQEIVGELQGVAEQQQESVDNLIKTSQQHQQTINDMSDKVLDTENIANNAYDKASDALSTSNTAKSTAETAKTTADNAKEIADQTLDADEHAKIVDIDNRVEQIEVNGVVSADTLPVGSQVMFDGENIPTGWKEVEAPYSNPNLLINTSFKKPVNQRGQSIYDYFTSPKNDYSIDRWMITELKLEINSEGIKLTNPSTTSHSFKQLLENPLTGTYTFSCFVKNATNKSAYLWCYTAKNTEFERCELDIKDGLNEWTFTGNIYSFGISIQANTFIDLEWAKMEYGEIATPFIPKNYSHELIDCCRYCEVVTISERSSYADKWITLENFRVPKRVVPTYKVLSFTSSSSNIISDVNNVYPTIESAGTLSMKNSYPYVKGVILFDAEIY